MTALRAHEAEVAARFDLLQQRFKDEAAPDDFRLKAIVSLLGDVAGLEILDLGAGKGRFARRLVAAGARATCLDLSAAMLAGGAGLDRVKGSARRLPFADASFDAVAAVEVFEHLAAIDEALAEARRVLKPGGLLAIVDKNAGALNASRPWLPHLLVKWVDEQRGRWMYPSGGPVRERWFRPSGLARRLRRSFVEVRVEHLLAPAEAGSLVFRHLPRARLFAVWSARAPGGGDE